MITYTIKEQAPDPKDSVIVKAGDTVELTISKIEKDEAYLEKHQKEIIGNMGIQKATLANINRTHPHIQDMSPEDLTAAYLHREATGFLSMAEEKLAEIKKQLADYASEKVEIFNQTGIVIPAPVEVVTPVETNG